MQWLDLFSQFDKTIYHAPRIPGKFNVVVNALLHHPDLAAVFGSVKSSLLTLICEA